MKHKDRIGFEVRTLNNLVVRRMVSDAEKYGIDEITVMHGWIIGYIRDNPDQNIYQKDIETKFSLAKSSVTCILKIMEKNGYITREAVPFDARLKKLCLTEKGIETDDRNRHNLDLMEKDLMKNLEPDEMEVFFKVTRKLKKYLEGDTELTKKNERRTKC